MNTLCKLTPTLVIASIALSCGEQTVEENLPPFDGTPVNIGVLLCASSEFATRAPNLERAALLAEEIINGSSRGSPGQSVETIACRNNDGAQHTCGVWSSRNETGSVLRGPARVIIADTHEHIDDAITAAARLKNQHSVAAIVGPCTMNETLAVFEQVTGTETLLVTPAVTANAITSLNDRATDTSDPAAPGYVYRTITPDYVQVQMLALFASNKLSPAGLIRHEDETTRDCTDSSADTCTAELGPEYDCLPSLKTADPEKIYFRETTERCRPDAAGICDSLGRNYDCIRGGSGKYVCSQYKERKWCTRVARPAAAMILYEDTLVGADMLRETQSFWETQLQKTVIAAAAFDPASPASFGNTITSLFAEGSTGLSERQAAGTLDGALAFGDTVVFLFADATAGALLLQEWNSQLTTLPNGSNSVYWLGTDRLRSSFLTDQVPYSVVRNVFVSDPSTLDLNSRDFFVDLFRRRWGTDPGEYAGGLFDAILLLALANERAGYSRGQLQPDGALPPNTSADLVSTIRAVSAGCDKASLADACVEPFSTYRVAAYNEAVKALGTGGNIRFDGSTGDLSLNIAGDRLGDFDFWKIGHRGTQASFFAFRTHSPSFSGLRLR